MNRHPLLLAVAAAAVMCAACGSGDADAHQTSTSSTVDRAEAEDAFHVLAARYERRDAGAQRRVLSRQLEAYGGRTAT